MSTDWASVAPPGLVRRDDPTGLVDDVLALEARASRWASEFLYGDDDALGRAVRGLLLERRTAEFAPPYLRLYLTGDRVAAMYALCSGAELRKRRMVGAMTLAREGKELISPALSRRLRLVSTTQAAVGADDAYLSRIAVEPELAGRGLGRSLVSLALAESRERGLRRCLLDVAEENAPAIAFYARAGFEEVGRAEVTDPETGRRVAHVHLSHPL